MRRAGRRASRRGAAAAEQQRGRGQASMADEGRGRAGAATGERHGAGGDERADIFCVRAYSLRRAQIIRMLHFCSEIQ
ncbi:hypothetical protein GQ55_1G282100 [Panicum hallii var. hallii]|uniref:Uncharacterized protein n=1 Tax=Panicum hallii var. hallii TaxID=1504633 RepID=A0A2T7F8D6_9POAL|nr:hypothetical protein GQ55_1G282100 [Panicum hallii var. hallii]